MVILSKNFETKEIEIQGFRKIINNPKHPDYREARMYIKQGWILVDTEDDAKELQKAKKRKQSAKKNKESRPKYVVMEQTLNDLLKENKISKEDFDAFMKERKEKNNYKNALSKYNDIMDEVKKKEEEAKAKAESNQKEAKNDKKESK